MSSGAYLSTKIFFSHVLNVPIATINPKSDKVEGPGEKKQVIKREHADSSLAISMSCYKFLPCGTSYR